MEIIERAWEARDLFMQIGGMIVVAASVMVAGQRPLTLIPFWDVLTN